MLAEATVGMSATPDSDDGTSSTLLPMGVSLKWLHDGRWQERHREGIMNDKALTRGGGGRARLSSDQQPFA